MVSWGAACRSPPSDSKLAARIRKGGDASGKLVSTPPVTRGSLDLAEGGLVRHTHLLHVDFYDAGRCEEEHAEFFVQRFSAR